MVSDAVKDNFMVTRKVTFAQNMKLMIILLTEEFIFLLLLKLLICSFLSSI